jgi:hypothetical protein
MNSRGPPHGRRTTYISYPDGIPLDQWAELNNSPQWSAFHLFKLGQRVDANAARA